MPIKSVAQTSFFSPEFADPSCLQPGSEAWLLRHCSATLFPDWLFAQWHGHGSRGRDAWPASVLLTALVLRSCEGVRARREMARRLKSDIRWRAAAGLPIGGPTPGESTFRRIERYLRSREPASGVPRYLLLHEHIIRVCVDEGIVDDAAVWAMDSTPMWCFGAVKDTTRLLGDGLRSLCKLWARLTKTDLAVLARQWDAPLLLAKSTKGHYRIDWKDAGAKATLVDDVARSVLNVVDHVRCHIQEVRRSKHKRLLRRCRHLLRVVADDLETDDEGRLVIAEHVAKDRLVSITDPQARHSRKTKGRPFHGYRLHVLGDVVSGLIASVSVTPANIGDARPAGRLIRRAKDLHFDITRVLGDTAYGGAQLHYEMRTFQSVDVMAPPPRGSRAKGKLGVADFEVDVEGGTSTCPADVTVVLKQGLNNRYFRWPTKVCRACDLRPTCFGKTASSRIIVVNKHHEEMVMVRKRWGDPQVREDYRTRSQCERLIANVVRKGGRQARAWGLQTATLQAHIAVMSCNLAILAKALARRRADTVDRAA